MLQKIEKMSLRSFWLVVAGILMVAGLFYAFLWREAPFLATDSANYMGVAQDLLDWKQDLFQVRPPGYPWLVMLSGSAETPARLLFYIQMGLYFAVIALLLHLMLRMGVARRLRLIFIVLMLLPYNVMPASLLLTETLAQFLLVAGVFTLVLWLQGGHFWLLLIAGLCLGYAGATRASYQVFSVFLALLLLIAFIFLPAYRRRLLAAAGVLVLCAALIVGSVCLHNYRSHGFFSTTPLTGFNLTQKTARVLERLPDEYACIRDLLIQYRNESLLSVEDNHSYYNYIWEVPINLLPCGQVGSYAELTSYLVRMNLFLILKAPLNYLIEVGYSLVNYSLPVVNRYSDFGSSFLEILWGLAHYVTLLFFLLACTLLAGLTMIWLSLPRLQRCRFVQKWDVSQRLQAWYTALALIVIFYTLGLTILIEMGEARTRLSTEPFIISLAILGLDVWLRVRRRLRNNLSNHLLD